MISLLSTSNNQTATAALRRNGSARLALEARGSSHRAPLVSTQVSAYGGESWSAIAACKPVSIPATSIPAVMRSMNAFGKSSVSIFGGSPFCATYATKQGLESNVARMPVAPLTLDPGANQEGGA